MSSLVRRAIAAPCVALLLVTTMTLRAQYDPPAGYYNSATGTGAALKAQLNAIIDGTSSSYDEREPWLELIDQDPANSSNILLVYTGGSIAKSQFPGGSANTEHLWPNSYGIDSGAPAYGDLFNLRACIVAVNSLRANKFFDTGGSPAAGAPLCKTDADSWEPRDVEKGDLARAMFYMDTRYEGGSNDGLSRNLALTDDTSLIGNDGNYMGKLSTLIAWHFQDPVSTEERARNHAIYTQCPQQNRNPYIDHPEYVWTVFGSGANNSQLYLGTMPPANGASTASLSYRLLQGATPPSQSLTLNKTGTHPTTYSIVANGALLSSSAGTGQAFTGGTTVRPIQVALDNTATPGLRTGTLIIDNTDLTSAGTGLGSADGNDFVSMTATVLAHSNASFAPDADHNTLTIDFGTVHALSGPHTQTASVYNLELVPGYTAGLDIDSVTRTGNTTVFSTDLTPSANLPAGQPRSFTVTLQTITLGTWQAVVTLSVSDEDVPGATSGTSLVLTLKATVVAAVVPPDFNVDGDVDADDYDFLAACMSGPHVTLATGCAVADLDGDEDVDQDDFGRFQRCFSGRDWPPFPDCTS